MEKNYMINQNLKYMKGLYDRHGKWITEVTQTDTIFLVDRSPLEIIKDSIREIGFDYNGAMKSAKYHLGDVNMCPVMINPIHKICVFPHKSAKHVDTIWFNPYYIKRTKNLKGITNVEFLSGQTLKVPCRLSSFNTKLQNAEQLTKITTQL